MRPAEAESCGWAADYVSHNISSDQITSGKCISIDLCTHTAEKNHKKGQKLCEACIVIMWSCTQTVFTHSSFYGS